MAENVQHDDQDAASRHTGFTSGHYIHSALTAGNVVTVAIQLFRAKSDEYITTSLQSYLWFFLTFLGAGCLGGVGYVLGQSLGVNIWPDLVLLAALCALPLLAYGRGRKTAMGGALSQLFFNKLVSRTETNAEIQQQLFPRTWTFLRAELLFWLVLVALYFGLALLLGVLLDVLSLASWKPDITDFPINTEPSFSFLLTLITFIILVLLLYLGMIIFFSYFVARLWLFDVVIALEEVTAAQAIGRSWQLTRNQGWQSLSVVLICGALLMPAFSVSSFLSIFGVFGLLVITIVSFPLYQAVKAVIYYDLRSRNEGLTFDLNLIATNPQSHLRRVMLQTPESIELDLALGGIGSRAFAWVIDQFLLWTGISLCWYFGSIVYLTILLPVFSDSLFVGSHDLNKWVIAIAGLLTFALSNGYFIAFESLWQGQTPGKRVAKIRVVRDTGQPVGIKECSIRSLLSTIDVSFFFIGVLLIGVTRSEKRLGDMVAGTLVVQNQQQGTPSSLHPFESSPRISQIAETLRANTNVKTLTPDQFLTLRDFLGYRSRLVAKVRSQITTKLANQLRHLLGQNNQPLALGIADLDLVEATYWACRQTHPS